jgi:hypothetical protein
MRHLEGRVSIVNKKHLVRVRSGANMRACAGLIGLRPFRRRRLAFLVALAAALIVVPVALASSRTYWSGSLGPGSAVTDVVYHNHNANSMLFTDSYCNQYCLEGLYEETSGGSQVWSLNGTGSVYYGHASTYYTTPFCWNRDNIWESVQYCKAYW